LLQALNKQGVPVAPPLASVDAQYRVIIDSDSPRLSMMVQPHIDGDLLDTSNETAVRHAGACLASLHRALVIHRDSRLIEVEPGLPVDLHQRIETWLELEDAGMAPTASARLRDQISSLPTIDSQQQLIHHDYRASNILTADSEILAVIDFDGVAWDYCINDIANAFVRLGTHFTNWQPTPTSVRGALLEATDQCDRSPGSNTNGSKHSCSGTASKPSRPVMIQPDGRTLCRTLRLLGVPLMAYQPG